MQQIIIPWYLISSCLILQIILGNMDRALEQTTAEWLKATSVGGRIYAVPVINGKGDDMYGGNEDGYSGKYNLTPELTLGKDINDSDMQKNLEELNYVFEIVKENEPDMITLFYPVANCRLYRIDQL